MHATANANMNQWLRSSNAYVTIIAVTATKPNSDTPLKTIAPICEFESLSLYLLPADLKLHHHRESQSRLVIPEVRAEPCCRDTSKPRRRRQKWTWHEQRSRHDHGGVETGDRARLAVHAIRDPAASRPVRNIRVAIPILQAERNVLLRHPVIGKRDVPSLERIAGILREV